MTTTTKPRRTFAPTITGSSWVNVNAATKAAASKRHGIGKADNGYVEVAVPRVSSEDVVALLMAWAAAVPASRMTPRWRLLWYQLGAYAYAWNPTTGAMTSTPAQGARILPDDVAVDLWVMLDELAVALDAEGEPNPRLAMDGRFDDVVFRGEVMRALDGDGASVNFQIPLPACKHPKTGKPSYPRKDPKTGRWTCDPVTVDDPITVVKKKADNLVSLVLLIVGAWVLFDNQPRRHRRS